MSLKEKMMENMLEKMSKEEKFEMMDKMMDKFFADMTSEDKQEMMQKMMPKMMGGGMPMMDMMKNMMSGNQGKGEKGFNPMEMCKQMMQSMTQSREMAEFATPELRGLFEDWVRQIEDEILQFVKDRENVNTEEIAEKFKISEESAIYILGKLAQKGKLKFKTDII